MTLKDVYVVQQKRTHQGGASEAFSTANERNTRWPSAQGCFFQPTRNIAFVPFGGGGKTFHNKPFPLEWKVVCGLAPAVKSDSQSQVQKIFKSAPRPNKRALLWVEFSVATGDLARLRVGRAPRRRRSWPRLCGGGRRGGHRVCVPQRRRKSEQSGVPRRPTPPTPWLGPTQSSSHSPTCQLQFEFAMNLQIASDKCFMTE